ncbi:MAG: hypothetical protein J6P89_01530 [Oscillospiraceae bacterium]|nr:hypothetical protein [Oscillospiraceae bacterium]
MERYTSDFLKHAFVRCSHCGKECEYGLTLPRNCEFLHLGEDGRLSADPEVSEPYCCDCIYELTGGKIAEEEKNEEERS